MISFGCHELVSSINVAGISFGKVGREKGYGGIRLDEDRVISSDGANRDVETTKGNTNIRLERESLQNQNNDRPYQLATILCTCIVARSRDDLRR